MTEYRTTQGDLWDVIALKVYGSEHLMHVLIEANPEYRHMVVFPANCILNVPEMTSTVNAPSLPWRRSA
jgi:phage tail protein X